MIRKVEADGAQWQLHYVGRRRERMAYLPELHDLARAGGPDRVRVTPSSEAGRTDFGSVLAHTPAHTAVYCCGPAALTDSVQAASTAAGLACHVERFAPVSSQAANMAFTARIASTDTELEVPADRSLLDVLAEADIDILTSCGEGTCGTCEVDVLEGVPDHRDSVLSPEEQRACDRMLVCVSRSCTPVLVLDL